MRLFEDTQKYVADTEEQAKTMMESFREEASTKGYTIKKSGYEYKTKKAKGEIVDECYVVTVTKVFGGIWEE